MYMRYIISTNYKKVVALESTDITIAQQDQRKITNIGFTILYITFYFIKFDGQIKPSNSLNI